MGVILFLIDRYFFHRCSIGVCFLGLVNSAEEPVQSVAPKKAHVVVVIAGQRPSTCIARNFEHILKTVWQASKADLKTLILCANPGVPRDHPVRAQQRKFRWKYCHVVFAKNSAIIGVTGTGQSTTSHIIAALLNTSGIQPHLWVSRERHCDERTKLKTLVAGILMAIKGLTVIKRSPSTAVVTIFLGS